MHKLVIFDLDGVLIESRELHYHSLNDALSRVGSEYIISREEHLSIYLIKQKSLAAFYKQVILCNFNPSPKKYLTNTHEYHHHKTRHQL
jgi:beta-phosphoglucomutase-like phosphatase (HAD superfamily)